jgi:putative membrane protein
MKDNQGGGARRPEPGLCRWLAGYLGCGCPGPARHEARVRNRRVHLANERTLLAWMRTALGIMAFGFVVHRFNLFARQLRALAPKGVIVPQAPSGPVHLGVLLMVLGSAVGVLAALRFLIVEREIETDTYRPSLIFNLSLALVLAALGLFLALSLWEYT